MSHTAIDSLYRMGYTDREAAFVYMVAVHSGYFLRRQFIACVQRERGGVATSFLRKAAELGHVTALPCSEGRYLYHLHGKQVYQIIGRADSQNRRMKSTQEIRRRLILLDYVLHHLGKQTFLESEEAGQQLFTALKVKPEAVSRTTSFLPSVPVSFIQTAEMPTVHFAFVDEAQRSLSRFVRFLAAYGPLIRSLDHAQVVYVSTSPMNFEAAQHLFARHMPLTHAAGAACPLGIEHLLRWLTIQQEFHHGNGSITPAEHQLFLEGKSLYCAPVHTGLIASWNNGTMDADRVRKLLHPQTHRAQFVSELIDADYPQLLNPDAGRSLGSLRGQTPVQNVLFDNRMAGSAGVEVAGLGAGTTHPSGVPANARRSRPQPGENSAGPFSGPREN